MEDASHTAVVRCSRAGLRAKPLAREPHAGDGDHPRGKSLDLRLAWLPARAPQAGAEVRPLRPGGRKEITRRGRGVFPTWKRGAECLGFLERSPPGDLLLIIPAPPTLFLADILSSQLFRAKYTHKYYPF